MSTHRYRVMHLTRGDPAPNPDWPGDLLIYDALEAYAENPDAYPVQAVPARAMHIPPKMRFAPEEIAPLEPADRVAWEHPAAPPLRVIETADGRLWLGHGEPDFLNDAYGLACYHQYDPDALIRVVIIGRDETPILSA